MEGVKVVCEDVFELALACLGELILQGISFRVKPVNILGKDFWGKHLKHSDNAFLLLYLLYDDVVLNPNLFLLCHHVELKCGASEILIKISLNRGFRR